jgi:hypothetical protein
MVFRRLTIIFRRQAKSFHLRVQMSMRTRKLLTRLPATPHAQSAPPACFWAKNHPRHPRSAPKARPQFLRNVAVSKGGGRRARSQGRKKEGLSFPLGGRPKTMNSGATISTGGQRRPLEKQAVFAPCPRAVACRRLWPCVGWAWFSAGNSLGFTSRSQRVPPRQSVRAKGLALFQPGATPQEHTTPSP